ncbi:DUF4124 domain-containing protein [Xanthomonas sp. AmX2]|uniref:DUF4124 domain-containing protein n=1 Tax=Xanthomonas sp. TaxID=29446 RepID=UPI00197DA093|nr:DUF4124 domain-containing protein [Xanthomonas sp.]MBN6151268.1 DUF4124 domain-containing protein [Xanthomonas sp.]
MRLDIGTFLLLALLGAGTGAAHAEEVVFYRCTDAQGALTLQNMPCAKGMRQEKKIMQGVNSAPAYAPAYVAPATPAAPAASAAAAGAPVPAPVAPPPASADAPRLPPPPLYQCSTRDRDSYVSEDAEPASRCLPLKTVGLDGSAAKAAGSACEVVRDSCARVPDGAACEAWKKYAAEAESHWRFAVPEHVEQRRQEYQRRQRVVEESSCGAPAQKP